METLETIKTRRSMRTYSPTQKLTPEQIAEVAEYGLYAPSAHNQQARKYYIITKQEDLEYLGNIMERGKMIPTASGVILSCFDENNIRSIEFIQQDMGASIENIRLAAHEKGYGMVRVGTYPHEEPVKEIKKHFNLEENIIPFAILPIGIPEGETREKYIKSEGKIKIL